MSGLVVSGHETWFTDGAFPLDWGFATQGLTVALLAGAVYGAMLVLLAYASDPKLRPAVSALWPFDRPALRTRAVCPAEG